MSHGENSVHLIPPNLVFKIESIDDLEMNKNFISLNRPVELIFQQSALCFMLEGVCNNVHCCKGRNSCMSSRKNCGPAAGSLEIFIQPILLKYFAEGKDESTNDETDEIGHDDNELKVSFLRTISG